MEQTVHDFFHDFRQELLAGTEAEGQFQLAEFMESITEELTETGFVEGFDFCHYRAQRGMRVDGYWFNDENALYLFIADFDNRDELLSLTRTEVEATFKRVTNFFEASRNRELYRELEETSPEYGLSREIADRKGQILSVNFFLLSERVLSDRLQILDDNVIADTPATYAIWDISRLQRQRASRGHKEPLDIDFQEMFDTGISCLRADLGLDSYQSYLIVIPGEILSTLYEKHGSRLLEQNVRSFLQARGKVNRGIRTTIISEPNNFFAYNNGITATAQEVETIENGTGLQIMRIRDLQIVNGGQTTASLFHTRRKDKASLERIFVQMKLSVIDPEESEKMVPLISQYANTQNRVSAADFYSNHPFHIRMEEFSRRIWAPVKHGEQRETKWFYERARGQYADAQSKMTPSEQRRFKAEYPRFQMFAKTDLAKFENVWEDHPKWVNLGAQKNFVQFAGRIARQWDKSPDTFNEFYYRRAITRAIVFRRTEKLISAQSWYDGGYRANIVAYTIAVIREICERQQKTVDFSVIWNTQEPSQILIDSLVVAAKFVNERIVHPPSGISNVTEWCKKDACWTGLQSDIDILKATLPAGFWDELISFDEKDEKMREAKKTQKIDNGIDAQKKSLEIGAEQWSTIFQGLSEKGDLSPKEAGILKIAQQIPARIPSEKQSMILMDILDKARAEGLYA
ncbi:MAG: AIPR family protein [Gammaproteobacteria bacterium]|nr:AIPR family protein [Gammaproteobacteria bacterium]